MHIVITGGTRGIGNGLVKEFLKKGHSVTFTGTSITSIENAKKSLKGDYFSVICDVRNMNNIKSLLEKAISHFGEIDVWINNAGVGQEDRLFYDISEAEIKKVIDINVLGTMLGTKLAIIQMKKQNHGSIYNLEGLGSNNMIIPKTILYGSSKRLISYFTKGCQKELKEEKNILIGTIQPGMVFTDLLLNNMSKDGMKIANILGNDVDYVAKKVYQAIMKNKKKIKILTLWQATWRFFKSIFVKTKNYKIN